MINTAMLNSISVNPRRRCWWSLPVTEIIFVVRYSIGTGRVQIVAIGDLYARILVDEFVLPLVLANLRRIEVWALPIRRCRWRSRLENQGLQPLFRGWKKPIVELVESQRGFVGVN